MAPSPVIALLLISLFCCSAAALTTCNENVEVIATLQAALNRAGSVNSALKEQVAWWRWHYGAETPCVWPWAKPGSLGVAMALGAALSWLVCRRGRRATLEKHGAQLAALQKKLDASIAKLCMVDREATQYLVRLKRVAKYGLAGCPDQAQQVAQGMSRQEMQDAPPKHSKDKVRALVAEFNRADTNASGSAAASPSCPPNPHHIAHLEAEITRLKTELAMAHATATASTAAADVASQQHQQLQRKVTQLEHDIAALQNELDDERVACKSATAAATAAQRRIAMLQKQLDQAAAISSSACNSPEPAPQSPRAQSPLAQRMPQQQQQQQQQLSPRSVRFADEQHHLQPQQQDSAMHAPWAGTPGRSPHMNMAVLQQHMLECTQQAVFAAANAAIAAAASGTAHASSAPSSNNSQAAPAAADAGFGLGAAALSPPPPLSHGWVTQRNSGTWAPFSPWTGPVTQHQAPQNTPGAPGHFSTPISAAAGGIKTAGPASDSLGSVRTAGPTPGSAGSISYVGGRQVGSSSTVPGSASAGGRYNVASGGSEGRSPRGNGPKMADVLASVAKLHQSVCNMPQPGARTPVAGVTPPVTPRHNNDASMV